jgi:mono/diheme cytochrome c family protein
MSTHGERWLILLFVFSSLTLPGCARSEAGEPPDPAVARGRTLFRGTCASCHATTDDDVIVGPSLAGIADRAGTRIPGMDADAYIHQSIVDPRAYTVEGFPDNMMPINYGQTFSPEDIDAIVAYLRTLKK